MAATAIFRRLRRVRRGARELDREGAAIADARDDRRFSGRRLDRDRDEALEFVETERKEFPGSSGGEQSGRAMFEQIRDMRAIFLRIEGAVGREMRDRKGQQTGADARLQVLGLDCHEVISRVAARSRRDAAATCVFSKSASIWSGPGLALQVPRDPNARPRPSLERPRALGEKPRQIAADA